MSNAPDDRAAIEARLEELERGVNGLRRSGSRQRLAILGMVVALAVLAVNRAGQRWGVPDELRVKRLFIIDDQGKERIVATTAPDGRASMTWLDRDGKARIDALTDGDGNAFSRWFDRDGTSRIMAATDPTGFAAVSWLDREGKPRMMATTYRDGTADMTWLDGDKKGRIVAGVSKDGTVRLPTKDLKEKP